MKAAIITQEEPFFIPIFLGKVLREFKEVAAIIVLNRSQKRLAILASAKELQGAFGWRYLLTYGVLFIYYKILDILSHWKQFRRFYSIKSAAKSNSIPLYKLKNINDSQSLNLLRGLKPDIIISIAAPQIFKKEVINLPRYTINIHAALLPEYRGRMPSFWVLAKGERKTGVTVHYVDENIDTGKIIVQKTINISEAETLHSLQNKVANVGAEALLEALEKIARGDAVGSVPQGKGSYYSFPTKEAAKEFRAKGRRFI